MDNFKEFPVSVYGELERISEVHSKGRVRIFYKGVNRNGSFISDEFAEKLIKSLPYAPVKGIFEDTDFSDHGQKRTEGRAFGVVMGPEDIDFKWEKHLDEDGVEREYACANVLLWTGLYEEAKQIPGKSQSMELYEPSIEGVLKYYNGARVFEFTNGCFLGLQVLGDDVEPCFEGSAFYNFDELLEKFNLYVKNSLEDSNKGGQSEMSAMNFKLADSQKAELLWHLINPNYNEEGNWEIVATLVDVYDEYAICFDYEHREYFKQYYTKSDENDTVELGEKEAVYAMYVTQQEKNILETWRLAHGETFSTLTEEFENKEQKIEELNVSISTLNTEKDEMQSSLDAANENISNLQNEVDGLKQFKLTIETQEKMAVINRYAELLDEEIIEKYTNSVNDFSLDNLEKELAFELVKTNPTVFSNQPAPQIVPKDEGPVGIEAVLSKYKK